MVMDGDGELVPGQPNPMAGYPAPPGRPALASPWRIGRADLTGALLVTAALTVLGLVVGVLWYLLAPRIGFRIDESGIPARVDMSKSEEFVAADGWFVILGVATGLVVGVGAWMLRRLRGPLIVVALAGGGLLGALLASWLGHHLAPAPSAAEIREAGRLLHTSLQLRSKAALVFEPFIAVAVYVVLTGFAGDDDLRGSSKDDTTADAGFGGPGGAPGEHRYAS